MNDARYNPALHRIALLTAAATFPLIFMGGLVTSKQAGMSVPDWPNSYGYNMFLFPPRLWVGGILYEHTHRLMGTVVGMLSILLAIFAWKTESRPWVRWFAASVLGAVIFQGVLGGLRVVLVKLNLAIIHACFAQAFFCLASLVAVVTNKWWIDAPNLSTRGAAGSKLIRAGVIAFLLIYIQLIAGAVMRHYQAGLAVPDFPLVYGKILPPTNADDLAAINAQRRLTFPDAQLVRDQNWAAIDQINQPVTLAQIWIHLAHRIGALLVTIALFALIFEVLRNHRDRALLMPAMILIVLLCAQVTLGILTIIKHKPADIASAHVAIGALTLMTTFVLTARACRLYSTKYRTLEFRVEVQPIQIDAPGRIRTWATQ